MRLWVRPALILVLVAVVPLPAWSIIIETKDGKVHRGHLVSQDKFQIVIRPEGQKETAAIRRAEIQNITQDVKPERLKALKPDDPKSYFDYAQELAPKKKDPEARDTALRLLLIAAHLDADKYGYKALTEMSKLARTPEEARAFRAVAFLLDLAADRGTLSKEGPGSAAAGDFLEALEQYRRGKTKEALELAKKKGVADFFAAVPGLMTHKEFVEACEKHPECTACKQGRLFCKECVGKGKGCTVCKGKGWTVCDTCKGEPRRVPLTPAQLEMILRLQLLQEKAPKGKVDVTPAAQDVKWSQLLRPSQMEPAPVLSLRHLTEFDPRQSVYNDGKWEAPPK
jgi:hypothetical protein